MTASALWPTDVTWRSVSPKLLLVRRIQLTAWLIPVAAAVIAVAIFTGELWLTVATGLVGLILLGWSWVVVGRAVRSWGYAERQEDLLIRHGVIYRRLSVVPYGRMQFVDVIAGPLDRLVGIATVQLHTAAAATDAAIPGLPPEEATRLRDRLAALGEAKAAGL